MTLQGLLHSKPELSERQLRLFDPAGDARIVLAVITGQHASVARDDALRILEEHSRFQSGQLTRIRRQRRAEDRKVVELAAQKRTTEASAHLESMGAVMELPGDKLHNSAAKSYLKELEKNKSVLLVAPTRNEIEAVTAHVRSALKTPGRLAGEEKEFHVFDSLLWTEAQKQDARQYRPGMAIRFRRSKAGFDNGERVEVVMMWERQESGTSPLVTGCYCKQRLRVMS